MRWGETIGYVAIAHCLTKTVDQQAALDCPEFVLEAEHRSLELRPRAYAWTYLYSILRLLQTCIVRARNAGRLQENNRGLRGYGTGAEYVKGPLIAQPINKSPDRSYRGRSVVLPDAFQDRVYIDWNTIAKWYPFGDTPPPTGDRQRASRLRR